MFDILLKNCNIITQNDRREVISGGFIGIKDGKIAYVSASPPEERAQEELDFSGSTAAPGLIDGHGHAGHSMTKLIASDSMGYWGKSVERIYFNFASAKFWYLDGKLAAIERLRSGVTCGLNVIANQPRTDTTLPAEYFAGGYGEVGGRVVVCVGPGENKWPKVACSSGKHMTRRLYTWEKAMYVTEKIVQSIHGAREGKTRVFITPFTCIPSIPTWGRTSPDFACELTEFDRKQLKAVSELAQKYKTGIHTDAFGGSIDLMLKSDHPLLGEHVLLQHCYDMSPAELETMVKTGTNMGHSAEQSFHYCQYSEFLAMGGNGIVTSDGNGPRVNFNMLQNLRRTRTLEALRFGEDVLDEQELLDSVTRRAAKAIGQAELLGSIEVGKAADIALYKGIYDVKSLVRTAGRVTDTLVGGKFRLRAGELTSVYVEDETELVEQADAYAREMIERAGLMRYIRQQPCYLPRQIYTDDPHTFPAGSWNNWRIEHEMYYKKKISRYPPC